jgi:hypothetical protein
MFMLVKIRIANLPKKFCARSGIFPYPVISRVELIRKDKEKFHSMCKIPPPTPLGRGCAPPGGKPALLHTLLSNLSKNQECEISNHRYLRWRNLHVRRSVTFYIMAV